MFVCFCFFFGGGRGRGNDMQERVRTIASTHWAKRAHKFVFWPLTQHLAVAHKIRSIRLPVSNCGCQAANSQTNAGKKKNITSSVEVINYCVAWFMRLIAFCDGGNEASLRISQLPETETFPTEAVLLNNPSLAQERFTSMCRGCISVSEWELLRFIGLQHRSTSLDSLLLCRKKKKKTSCHEQIIPIICVWIQTQHAQQERKPWTLSLFYCGIWTAG